MGHRENARRHAHADEDETLLVVRVVGIVDDAGIGVVEGFRRFLERHGVLTGVQLGLMGIPLKVYVAAINHIYMIHI